MRIVIAADIYPPDIGGPATYASRLREQLIAAGHQVNLICYADELQQQDDTIIRISRRSNVVLRYWSYYRELIKLARKADVLYTMGPVSAGLPTCAAGWFTSTPYVVKVVGDYAWEQARVAGKTSLSIEAFQYHTVPGKTDLLKLIERFVCKKAARVIVPSRYLKGIVEKWGVAEDSISVVYNAIKLPPSEFRMIPKDKNIIVSAGRFVPWKGFDTLIQLFPRLRSEISSELQLKIFGSGPEQFRLEKLIKENNLEQCITIQHASHIQLLHELSTAGCFVLNSGYEGLPHVVLEAASVGVPLALARSGGMVELADKGVAAHYFDYNDQDGIAKAISQALQQNGVSPSFESAMFSSEEMFTKTIQELASVCAS